jgi:hypothetical protein
MGPYIVSIFQYISNKMQRYTLYLYLETALHISGGTSTHHQERIQLYLQHLVFVTPLLLSVAIVEELEPVWVCCGWRAPLTAHSNWEMILRDSHQKTFSPAWSEIRVTHRGWTTFLTTYLVPIIGSMKQVIWQGTAWKGFKKSQKPEITYELRFLPWLYILLLQNS